jgi:outer membrane protein assembly factor BamB
VITGTYFELISGNPFGGNFRVFVRTRDGTFTTFDAATYAPCCIWSFPSGINPAGAITGSFNDGFSINHGFLRATDGTVTTFDVPGAGAVHNKNQGTVPLGITPAGEIMGLYIDANSATHGFLFLHRRDRDDRDDSIDR